MKGGFARAHRTVWWAFGCAVACGGPSASNTVKDGGSGPTTGANDACTVACGQPADASTDGLTSASADGTGGESGSGSGGPCAVDDASGGTSTPSAEGGGPVATTTVGDPSNPGALYGAIMAAYNTGKSDVTVNPGTYDIPVNTSGGNVYAWVFKNVANLALHGAGVVLNFVDTHYQLVNFTSDQNFTFDGFQIAGPPNFTQGKIFNAASDANGNYIDVTLDAGYPTDWSDTTHWGGGQSFQVFDQNTRRWKPGTGDYGTHSWPPATLSASNRQYRFDVGNDTDFLPASGLVANGDYVAIRGNGGRFFNVDSCKNLTFENLTISTAACAMWEASGNDNLVIDRCNFVYQPPPPGGTDLGLLGPTGIASGNNVNGLTMTNSTWQGSDDDVINSDSGGGMSVGQINGTTLTLTSANTVATGNTLYFYDNEGNFLGQDTATANATSANFTPPDNSLGTPQWYTVTLSKTLALAYKDRVFNVDHTAEGFVMRNDVIQNFRDVGVIASSNSVIDHCIFDSGTVSAIVTESYANGMVIENNVISNNGLRWGYGNSRSGSRNGGAIQIDDQFYYPGATGQDFQNTLIRNNIFFGNGGIDVALVNAAGSQITNNAFVDGHPAGPGSVGKPAGLVNHQDSNTSIWLADDNGVTLSGDTFVGEGPYDTSLAEQGPACTGVTGAASGALKGTENVYDAAKAEIHDAKVQSGGGSQSGQYVTGIDNADSYVKFTVTVPAAADYAVLVFYDNDSNVDTNGFAATATQSLVVNGNACTPLTVTYPFTGAWGSFNSTYMTGVYATLNAGTNTLRFNHATNGAELDTVAVVLP